LPRRAQVHINLLETSAENQALLLAGLDYVIAISYVEESEVFKTCLDYWNYLVPDIYSSVCAGEQRAPPPPPIAPGAAAWAQCTSRRAPL
jgi:exportin-1